MIDHCHSSTLERRTCSPSSTREKVGLRWLSMVLLYVVLTKCRGSYTHRNALLRANLSHRLLWPNRSWRLCWYGRSPRYSWLALAVHCVSGAHCYSSSLSSLSCHANLRKPQRRRSNRPCSYLRILPPPKHALDNIVAEAARA